MKTENIDLFKIFADDKRLITYRPEWRKFTESVTATILLQQILYRWDKNYRRPFYKFRQPCSHELYVEGDSWTEELGFSRKEFDTAIKKIGYKQSKIRHEEHDKPVEYWVNQDRVTFYTIHEENLTRYLLTIYQKAENNSKQEDSSVSPQKGFRKSSPVNPQKGLRKLPNWDLDVNPQKGFRKNPNGDLDQDHSETSSEKKKTTKIWETILKDLEKRINRASFNTWLRPTQLVVINDGEIIIGVSDEVCVHYLEEHYKDIITEVLTKRLDQVLEIKFQVIT